MTMILIPAKGCFGRVSGVLLSLADHPSQVEVVSLPAMGFDIPSQLRELAVDRIPAKYLANSSEVRQLVLAVEAVEPEEVPVIVEPDIPVKRRGRPKKIKENVS
jgi:hypothetical protein